MTGTASPPDTRQPGTLARLALALASLGAVAAIGCEPAPPSDADPGPASDPAAEIVPQALSSDATGYMVEVHTCNEDNAGTDSLIRMRIDIRDPDWQLRTLGPWTQDHVHPNGFGEYDDHEKGAWDRYFFPESTPTAHIERLWLDTNGSGSWWCWDRLYVTRIENNRSIWTWAWERREEVPGKQVLSIPYNFDWGDGGRPVPPGLRTPAGAAPTEHNTPRTGAVRVSLTADTTAGARCEDETFRVRSSGRSMRVMAMKTPMGNGLARCTWGTLFDGVAPGNQVIDRVTPFGVGDCKTVNVIAGRTNDAAMLFGRGCPQ